MLTVVGIIIMMLTISWLLTIVVVLTLPLSVVVVARIARRSQGYFVRQQKALGELNGHVAEMYAGHTIVTAFGHEARAVATFDELNEKYYDGAWRAQFVTGIMFPIMMFIGNLGYVAVAVIGGLLVTRAGDRARRRAGVHPVQPPVLDADLAVEQHRQLHPARPSPRPSACSSCWTSRRSPPKRRAAATLPAPRGDVQFDHVAFSYKADAPLIEDLSIQVSPGQMVAIVGPTGAGKTTLVNLLMRFYDVNAGSIRVDGVDIRELSRGGLRRMFGMVLQDTWLFSGSIRDNIAYGREGASDEEIVHAARAAQADHFIRTLPDNYDTRDQRRGDATCRRGRSSC